MRLCLLDSSALRRLANVDPHGVAANKWAMDRSIAFALSPLVAMEMIATFIKSPFSAEASLRCRFVTQLETLHLLKDNALGVLNELFDARLDQPRSHWASAEVEQLMRADIQRGLIGFARPELLALINEQFSRGKMQVRTSTKQAFESENSQSLVKCETFQDAMLKVGIDNYARESISAILHNKQVFCSSESVSSLCARVSKDPISAPWT